MTAGSGGLALKRTIKPLYFIRTFSRYAVADRTAAHGRR